MITKNVKYNLRNKIVSREKNYYSVKLKSICEECVGPPQSEDLIELWREEIYNLLKKILTFCP